MVFLVVRYGCGSCTIKKTECGRTDAFELWYWRRLSRVLWTARRSNQLIAKNISPEYSLEGLMLKLMLQYFGLLSKELTHLKRPWCWEVLKAGGEGDDRGWDGQMASPTRGTWVWVSSGSWWWTGMPGMLQSVGSQIVGHDWATELNWLMKSQDAWGPFFLPPCSACGILVLQPRTEPITYALEAWGLNHWTTGKSHAWGLLIPFSAFPGHTTMEAILSSSLSSSSPSSLSPFSSSSSSRLSSIFLKVPLH